MKLHFITFADGIKQKYIIAAMKLCEMAAGLEIFSSFKLYTVNDLIDDEDFSRKHMEFIQSNPRGFGYWIWKPYIMWKRLQEVEEGDVVIYMDACTTINVKAKNRFMEYLVMQQNSPHKNFFIEMTRDTVFSLRRWTKKDCIQSLDASSLLETTTVTAGILFVTCSSFNKDMFEFIYKTCSNHHLIDDSPSVSPNDPTFAEHRHDQCVISILLRKLCPSSIFFLPDELYFTNTQEQRWSFPLWIQSNNY